MIFQRMIGDQRNHKQPLNNANIAENILISPSYVVKTSFQVDIEIYEDKLGKSGDRIHSSHITNRPLAGYGLPPPRGHFLDHIFLEAQCLAKILQHVSPLTMAALSCSSLLHTLPYKIFDN